MDVHFNFLQATTLYPKILRFFKITALNLKIMRFSHEKLSYLIKMRNFFK